MDKKRIVKDYDKLPEEVVARVKEMYPYGFAENLISFNNKDGKKVSALPFETDDIYYLIRMTVSEARQIIEDDEDYDKAGNLRDDFSTETSEYDGGDEETDSKDDDDDDYDDEESSIKSKKRKSGYDEDSDDDY